MRHALGGILAAVTTRFEFQVTDVFQISGRAGLIVTGTVLQGEVRPGTLLRDAASGCSFDLLGIELACPRPRRDHHEVGLLVPRTVQDFAVPGRIWIAEA
jgi:hypothetical protein